MNALTVLIDTATPLRLHVLDRIVAYYPTAEKLRDAIEFWESDSSDIYEFRPDWNEMANQFQSYEQFTLYEVDDYKHPYVEQSVELLDGMVYTEINILYKLFDKMGDNLDSNYDYIKTLLAKRNQKLPVI